jgi:hypothetical protein
MSLYPSFALMNGSPCILQQLSYSCFGNHTTHTMTQILIWDKNANKVLCLFH